MKAAVLHAYDEKLTGKEFVKYEDVADPEDPFALRRDRADRRRGRMPDRFAYR